MISLPILKTDADLGEALARIDTLIDAAPGSPEADELTALSDLVCAYEDRHHPMPTGGPLAMLRRCMETHGLTQSQVPEIGNQSVVSAVLRGRRQINARMARALGRRFALEPSAFL